jgi:hypothetical protein
MKKSQRVEAKPALGLFCRPPELPLGLPPKQFFSLCLVPAFAWFRRGLRTISCGLAFGSQAFIVGNFPLVRRFCRYPNVPVIVRIGSLLEASMHGLIYLIGLIVVIMFILSLLGLR